MLIESLNKPRMAVCGVNTGNVKSEWKCLFNCSQKYLVELHSQSKSIGVSSYVIVEFLLFQRDIAFYLRTKFCVRFYIEKNANMYFKLSDVVI